MKQTEEVNKMLDQQRDYVLRTVEERGVRLVRLWFTDVLGNLKSFAISPAEMENALDDGMSFDGSSIDGFSRVQESDVVAEPDAATFGGDPRQVLRRNLEKARELGFTFLTAPDMEFFYFAPPVPGQPPVPL